VPVSFYVDYSEPARQKEFFGTLFPSLPPLKKKKKKKAKEEKQLVSYVDYSQLTIQSFIGPPFYMLRRGELRKIINTC
jgi:hypothetical protein